ncbi:MAG TPA: hypothetical protein DCO75_10185 [Fibrobacteres bacterium]|jgi:hypothetical protein|nr:hypothetical protein [Fibrobacterota bacterium]
MKIIELEEYNDMKEKEFQNEFEIWATDNETEWKFIGVPEWLINRKTSNSKFDHSLSPVIGVLGEDKFYPDVYWKLDNKETIIELKKSISGKFEELAFMEVLHHVHRYKESNNSSIMPVMITSPSDWNRCAFKYLIEQFDMPKENIQGINGKFGYLETTLLKSKDCRNSFVLFEEPFSDCKITDKCKVLDAIRTCDSKDICNRIKCNCWYLYENGSKTYWGTNVKNHETPITRFYWNKDKNGEPHDAMYAMVSVLDSNKFLIWFWDADKNETKYYYICH